MTTTATTPQLIDQAKVFEELEGKTKEFDALLDGIESLTSKQKALWKEIYANAIKDRHLASMMFHNLLNIVLISPHEYAVHSPNMAKFLERMSRSNQQLLDLSTVVGKAQEEAAKIDPSELYDQLEKH